MDATRRLDQPWARLRAPWWSTFVHRLRVRSAAYGLAALAATFAMVVTVDEATTSEGWLAFVALFAVGAPLLPRRRRTAAFGVAAAFVAMWAPAAPWLAFTVAAGVLVAVVEDQDTVAWRGWCYGLTGAVLSVVLHPRAPGIDPFIGVLVGGLVGLLVRARVRGRALEVETGRLRDEAQWLEQRTAVARELHDVVGHHVTAMVVRAEAGLVTDPRAALETIGDIGRTALTELDALVVHLRDPDAPMVLSALPRLADIDELLASALRHSGVAVDVRIDDSLDLDETTILAVYRIAQEALTNVTRHAQATRAWVEVAPEHGQVHLRVADDGVGLRPQSQRPRGAGLVGIEERVTALGGRWAVTARPGGGTMLDVHLPLSRRVTTP